MSPIVVTSLTFCAQAGAARPMPSTRAASICAARSRAGLNIVVIVFFIIRKNSFNGESEKQRRKASRRGRVQPPRSRRILPGGAGCRGGGRLEREQVAQLRDLLLERDVAEFELLRARIRLRGQP